MRLWKHAALASLAAAIVLWTVPIAHGEDAGHCSYVQQNMFAGPFKVCQAPANAAQCEELGETDDNHDAVHGDGDCSADGAVGTCDLGDSKVVYYEGEPGGLEIGCGFQGGDWLPAE